MASSCSSDIAVRNNGDVPILPLRNHRNAESSSSKSPMGHGYIPKSLSTNGIPKTISIAASKSFLQNGNLDFNLLDMSVDDGNNTPLDVGTRSLRFVSAASNLVDHFVSPKSVVGDSPNRPSPEPKVEPMSGFELDGTNKRGPAGKVELATAISGAVSSKRFEMEPLTPPKPAVEKRMSQQQELKLLSPEISTPGTYPTFILSEERGSHRWGSLSATQAVNRTGSTTNPTLHLLATDVSASGYNSKDQKDVEHGTVAVEYSVDEVTPNPTSETPPRTKDPQETTTQLPEEDTSLLQQQRPIAYQEKVKKKRFTIQSIPFVKRIASNGDEDERSPREGDERMSLVGRMSLIKRWSSQMDEDEGESPITSQDQAGAELAVGREGNGKKSILGKLVQLKQLSSHDQEGSPIDDTNASPLFSKGNLFSKLSSRYRKNETTDHAGDNTISPDQGLPANKEEKSNGGDASEVTREKLSLQEQSSAHPLDGSANDGATSPALFSKAALFAKLSSRHRRHETTNRAGSNAISADEGQASKEEKSHSGEGSEVTPRKLARPEQLSSHEREGSASGDASSPSILSKVAMFAKFSSRYRRNETANCDEGLAVSREEQPHSGDDTSKVPQASDEGTNFGERVETLKRQVVNFLYRFVD